MKFWKSHEEESPKEESKLEKAEADLKELAGLMTSPEDFCNTLIKKSPIEQYAVAHAFAAKPNGELKNYAFFPQVYTVNFKRVNKHNHDYDKVEHGLTFDGKSLNIPDIASSEEGEFAFKLLKIAEDSLWGKNSTVEMDPFLFVAINASNVYPLFNVNGRVAEGLIAAAAERRGIYLGEPGTTLADIVGGKFAVHKIGAWERNVAIGKPRPTTHNNF